MTSNVEWDIIKHVESRRTNTYGEVEFHGTNRKTRAKVSEMILDVALFLFLLLLSGLSYKE